jgi:hypothetical protein
MFPPFAWCRRADGRRGRDLLFAAAGAGRLGIQKVGGMCYKSQAGGLYRGADAGDQFCQERANEYETPAGWT